MNRLLFDRDIRDTKAWVSRKSLGGPGAVDEVAGQEEREEEEGREPR